MEQRKIIVYSKKLQKYVEIEIFPDYREVDPVLSKTIGMSNDDYG